MSHPSFWIHPKGGEKASKNAQEYQEMIFNVKKTFLFQKGRYDSPCIKLTASR
jgi:hypothetical protein